MLVSIQLDGDVGLMFVDGWIRLLSLASEGQVFGSPAVPIGVTLDPSLKVVPGAEGEAKARSDTRIELLLVRQTATRQTDFDNHGRPSSLSQN